MTNQKSQEQCYQMALQYYADNHPFKTMWNISNCTSDCFCFHYYKGKTTKYYF